MLGSMAHKWNLTEAISLASRDETNWDSGWVIAHTLLNKVWTRSTLVTNICSECTKHLIPIELWTDSCQKTTLSHQMQTHQLLLAWQPMYLERKWNGSALFATKFIYYKHSRRESTRTLRLLVTVNLRALLTGNFWNLLRRPPALLNSKTNRSDLRFFAYLTST